MKQLVTPWYGGKAGAGACLYMAQLVVGAGGGPYSATVAANATQYRHHDRNFPNDSISVLWFDHWGTYEDYRNGELRYENWGHVVIRDPHAFGTNQPGYFSSRRNGYGEGEWFRSVGEVEASFNSTYRFWSEDLNGVRVCEPDGTTTGTNDTPESGEEEDEEMANQYIAKVQNKKQINAVFNTVSGFFHEFESSNGSYNTNIARTFGVKDPTSIVSASHYDAVKRDCAAVRTGK